MRIGIDRAACTGHGRCYELAPQVVADDEHGYGEVRGDGEIGPATLPAARAAVSACPERAFHLDE